MTDDFGRQKRVRHDATQQIAVVVDSQAMRLLGGQGLVGHMEDCSIISGRSWVMRAQQAFNFAAHPRMRDPLMAVLGHQTRDMPQHLPIPLVCHHAPLAALGRLIVLALLRS